MMRSNYFAVRNAADFLALCDEWGFTPIQNQDGLYGFLGSTDMDLSGDFFAEQEEGEGTLAQHLALMLAEHHVAVVIEIANDHMRFLSGMAWAVNHDGEERMLNLDEIHQRAKELGSEVTYATY